MDQDRKRLLEVWRWLPLFRLVAETESVTRASRAFSVSPPAVSRALQQIERAIGKRLFDRIGRRLALNPHGHALMTAVTNAESRLSEVLADLGDEETAGHVRMATVGQLGRVFLAPSMRALLQLYPRLEASIVHVEPSVALDRLKGGTLDLFLGLNVAVGDPLIGTRLADLEIGVYAGREHPLFGQVDVPLSALAEHPFAAQLRPGLMRSVWPPSIPRRVTLETDSHAVALDACVSGSHLMAMERVIARPFLAEGKLTEIKTGFLDAARLVLCRHQERGRGTLISKVAKAIAQTVREIVRGASDR
jgi:DNA-binding transcriptional LysR family regulator